MIKKIQSKLPVCYFCLLVGEGGTLVDLKHETCSHPGSFPVGLMSVLSINGEG